MVLIFALSLFVVVIVIVIVVVGVFITDAVLFDIFCAVKSQCQKRKRMHSLYAKSVNEVKEREAEQRKRKFD